MTDDTLAVLSFLHEDLPRAGPGSEATTRAALAALPPLDARARVLDLGCGPGQQTLVLAAALPTPVIAVDVHQPFLDQLARAAAAAGLGARIECRCAAMETLDEAPASVDLVWCEGAAYIPGVERVLAQWRGWLKPGGHAVFSELVWLTATPPAEAAASLTAEYPAITDVAGTRARVAAAGLITVTDWTLPTSDWLQGYYRPLEARLPTLATRAAAWPALAETITEMEREIDLYRRHHDSFGYQMFIVRAP